MLRKYPLQGFSKWYYFFVDEGTSKEEIEKKIDESKRDESGR